jgi:hypothetical protein
MAEQGRIAFGQLMSIFSIIFDMFLQYVDGTDICVIRTCVEKATFRTHQPDMYRNCAFLYVWRDHVRALSNPSQRVASWIESTPCLCQVFGHPYIYMWREPDCGDSDWCVIANQRTAADLSTTNSISNRFPGSLAARATAIPLNAHVGWIEQSI